MANQAPKFQLSRRDWLRAGVASGSALAFPTWAQSGGEIRVGQSTQLTGPLAPSFTPVLKGQELAIKEVNAKGGIGGRRLTLITLDDAYDPKQAVENTRKLIDDEKVVALFGYASTANVAAALPLMAERKIPMIGTYAGSPSLRVKQHPYFFTAMASYRDEVVQMIRNLVTTQRTRLGLMFQNHPFGQLMQPIVEEVAKEQGATLVGTYAVESTGLNAAEAAQSLSAQRPQAVLWMGFGPATVGVVKGVRALIGVPIYALGIANAKPIVAALGEEARGLAFTQIIPYPWRQTSQLTRDFAAAMARENLPIDYDHFFGYLSTRVLIEALKEGTAGGRAPTSSNLVAGLQGMGRHDMGGYALNFSPNRHHGSNFVEITIVGPNGRFIR